MISEERDMAEPTQGPSFVPALHYKKPLEALDWLEKAFGFERTMLIMGDDQDERMLHAQMSFGDGTIMVGGEWTDTAASPLSTGGRCTQDVHVYLSDDIDAHCARARAAGAKIVEAPEDQFYGARTYRALDPEGHMWTFSQHVRTVSREEMEAKSGLKFRD
jgi:uncharacterized glyoxalase superfamily protein PhnB